MNNAYIFLADGFEEIEALATADVLRRGGVPVQLIATSDQFHVTGSHGIQVIADMTFNIFCAEAEELDPSDALIFPGGMPGTKNLAEEEELMDLMKEHYADGGIVAAICAAPGLVVSQLPTLEGRKFTCYDGFEEAPAAKGGTYVKAPSVTDGPLITGRGPAFAVDFALAILEKMRGHDKAAEVKAGLLL